LGENFLELCVELPYILKIDRSSCISDSVCEALCPDVFELSSDDGFSQIVEKYRVNSDLSEGKIPDDLAECAQKAADSCPVLIISVEKK
jgi:ferredoxin